MQDPEQQQAAWSRRAYGHTKVATATGSSTFRRAAIAARVYADAIARRDQEAVECLRPIVEGCNEEALRRGAELIAAAARERIEVSRAEAAQRAVPTSSILERHNARSLASFTPKGRARYAQTVEGRVRGELRRPGVNRPVQTIGVRRTPGCGGRPRGRRAARASSRGASSSDSEGECKPAGVVAGRQSALRRVTVPLEGLLARLCAGSALDAGLSIGDYAARVISRWPDAEADQLPSFMSVALAAHERFEGVCR